jgi:hypothetical protein
VRSGANHTCRHPPTGRRYRAAREHPPAPRHCRIASHIVRGVRTVARPPQSGSSAGPVAQWLEPAAHNGLVAGSSPAGPTNEIKNLLGLVRDHRTRNAPLRLRLPCLSNSQTNVTLRTRLGPLLFDRRFGGLIARNGRTRCSVPAYDGAFSSSDTKDALRYKPSSIAPPSARRGPMAR